MMDVFDIGEDGERWCAEGYVSHDEAKERVERLLRDQGVRSDYPKDLVFFLTYERGWWGYDSPDRLGDPRFLYADINDDAKTWTFIKDISPVGVLFK